MKHLGGLHYTGIETIHRMAAFIITQERKVQARNLNPENHGYCVWDRKGVLLVDFLPYSDTINSMT